MEGYFPRLSHEEQVALSDAARAGDVDARNQLALSIMPFAMKLAGKFKCNNNAFPREDRESVATLGVYAAIQKWNPERSRLTTYASRAIHQHLVRAFKNDRTIRCPDHWPEEDRKKFRACQLSCINNSARRRDNGGAPPEWLGDGRPDASDEVELSETCASVLEEAETLTPNMQKVMWLVADGYSHTDIAPMIGVSISRISQIAAKATQRLRRNARMKELADALDAA